MTMGLDPYRILAVRYATRDGMRSSHFVGGDPHDRPMPMDYYLWVAYNDQRTVLIDTGFHEDMAIKRHRRLLHTPTDALRRLGFDPDTIRDIVITHMHNDHVGGFDDYPQARFHLQDAEMAFATGRHMTRQMFRRAYEPDHVTGLVRMVYKDRVVFHLGDGEVAPGVTVHHVGGHTAGMQVVRVLTARGWVVLASDASHFYEHFETDRCFSLVFSVGDTLQGYDRLQALADSPQHIIPGHDPLVMHRYPPVSDELGDLAVRLDLPPLSPTPPA